MKKVLRTIALIAIVVSIVIVALSIRPCWLRVTTNQIPSELVAESKKMIAEGVDEFETPMWQWWNEMQERDPDFLAKMPIVFYGKVVDESNGAPIKGARIDFQWADLSPNRVSNRATYSDAQGKFHLSGVRGMQLSVHPYKDGYYTVNRDVQKSFEYAAFFEPNFYRPDLQNPAIFKLHKAHGTAEGLLVRECVFKVIPNGEPTQIALRTASRGAPADITISINRDERMENRRYDWNATIAGMDGAGLIECDDEFMFEAPEGNYEEMFCYKFKTNSPQWKNSMEKKYYVRSSDGKTYARIEVRLRPKYQDNAAAFIKFHINPTGSRNLESPPNMNLPEDLRPARR